MTAVKNSTNPAVGIKDESEARNYLLSRGIQSFQLQAAYLPLSTDKPLPITEAAFSEQTRSQRRSRHIRTTQWINHTLGIDMAKLMAVDEFLKMTSQVIFITYEEYKKDGLE